MHLAHAILFELLAVIGLGIGVIALFRRFNLPTLLGYLAVGFAIQVIGSEVFHEFNQLQYLAKYGVAFLLFTIGLEFSLTRLIAMRKAVFVIGGLQVFICALIFWLGLSSLLPLKTSFILAFAFAFSSTALISKHLTETGELQTHCGHLAIAILIFQDIMVVPLIIITTALGSQDANAFSWLQLITELVKGLVTFGIIILAGKYVFNPILHEAAKARSREVFLLAVLFIVLAATTFSETMGMSMELGAFLAGVMLGGSQYHHQVEVEIRPFRDILLGLFFVGIGSLINITLLPQTIGWMLLIAVALIALKLIIISLVIYKANNESLQEALKVGLLLCQGSEFGFVLIALASNFHIINNPVDQIGLGAIVLSMIGSMLIMRHEKSFLALARKYQAQQLPLERPPTETTKSQTDALIIGFGRVGQQLSKMLLPQGYTYTALDLDPKRVQQAQLAGNPVLYGDGTDPHMLQKAGLTEAALVVITCADHHMAKRLTLTIRHLNSQVPILVRSKDHQFTQDLLDAGATEVIPESLEASITLGAHSLVSLGMPNRKVTYWCHRLREQHYAMLSTYFTGESDFFDTEEHASTTQQRAVQIAEHSKLIKTSLEQLKNQFPEIDIIGLRRQHKTLTRPNSATELREQDVLIYTAPDHYISQIESLAESGQTEFDYTTRD